MTRKLASEFLGTALLLSTVVGSGMMAERLSGGNVGVALLANALATGAGLIALILTFGPLSGAHFNPVVSFAEASRGALPWRDAARYLPAQVTGAIAGVVVAQLMFGEAPLTLSQHERSGAAQVFSEAVATFGLLSVIFSVSRSKPDATPFAVAAYIVAAYWFTASTSFANPAVTLARSFTNTFAGIRLADAPGFVLGQVLGGAAAVGTWRLLLPPTRGAA